MIARARSTLTPLLVLLAAAALAYAISCIPTLGVARAAEPPIAAQLGEQAPAASPPPAASPRPSDALHDPVLDPAGAIDDAAAAKRQGWPILVLVGVVLVSRGLGTARRRWPGSRALRWMSGRAGLITIGSGAIAAAAFDALVLGGSWFAAGYAALGAALALIDPGPVQPAPARNPERGSAAGPVLAWLACAGALYAAGLAWGCAPTKHVAKATTAAVVDCTAETLARGAEAYAGRVRDAVADCTAEAGTDWGCVGAKVGELGREVGLEVAGCAAMRVAADMLAPTAVPVDRAGIEAGWERVREEHLEGRTFETGRR